MAIDQHRTIAVSGDGKTAYLSEGLCGHCGKDVMFRPPKPAFISRVLQQESDDDYMSRVTEDFLVGVCASPSCRRSTVVRRTYEETWSRGDFNGISDDSLEIVYPRPRSSRKPLPEEVPLPLREKYDEAAAIEFLSPTAAGFLVGRLVEQAIRHRLRLDGKSKRNLRKTTLSGLIQAFIDTGHGTEDLHEALIVVQGFRNFAAHPPQPEDAAALDITREEASFLLDVCRELLDVVYGRPARIAAMKERLEAKKRNDAAAVQSVRTVPADPVEVTAADFQVSDDDVPF